MVNRLSPKLDAKTSLQGSLEEQIANAFNGQPLTDDSSISAQWVNNVVYKWAMSGYFLTSAGFRRCVAAHDSLLQVANYWETPLNRWFEQRSYTIRHPNLADLPTLLHLEERCWIEPLRATEEELRQRIETYPEGHYAIDLDGDLVGVVYAQRIVDAAALMQTNFRDVATLHTADGSIAQPLAINIDPDVQQYGLGDQLLEFLLQLLTLNPDIEQVAAVTLCKQYYQQSDMPMEEYIYLQNAHGRPVDPILNFHVSHGAQILGVINDYRPADVENQGKGVLIAYDLQSRLNRLDAIAHNKRTTQAATRPIPTIIDDAIRFVMGKERAHAFSRQRPLMELGFGSAELLELRTLLSQELQVDLEPTFFFRYSTANALIDYFQHGKEAAAPARPTRSAHQYTLAELQSGKGTERQRGENTPIADEPMTQLPNDINTPIAIVGMACRFPGGVTNPAEFWELLRNGVDAIGEVPSTRWDVDALYGEGPKKIRTRYGGFLENIDGFDAPFFHIAPVEAEAMDPQQRLLLETHWEALEDAGIDPTSLVGQDVGIYVGIFSDDYKLLQTKQGLDLSTYFGTGTSSAVAAGRIAYFLGTEGPATAIDTACSSSLVALHFACQSLKTGESSLAMASGVNLILSPELSVTFSQANMLAPDGRCKTFDAAANGYVRSEGCGVVVLKRLQDAQADGDTILAVIRGTAINQDGSSNGLTAPSGTAQEGVIQRALNAAQLDSRDVSYVEAHGTGTPLGDPIEVSALEATYGTDRDAGNPLIVGSVKTNIGHTEAAAGMAGLMKVVLALQHGYIPPHLHFQQINPHLAAASVEIPAAGREWTQADAAAPRRGAVSSFGFSGTNAHAILEEAPTLPAADQRLWRPYHLLALSARNEEALVELAAQYRDRVATNYQDEELADLAHSTHVARTHFNHRVGLVAATAEEVETQLAQFLAGEPVAGLSQNQVIEGTDAPKIAFLFTGQGAQYLQMGRELYETQSLFRQRIEECDAILQACLGRSLIGLLYPATVSGSPLGHNDLMKSHPCGQAANFAIECALADLWRSWGVEPDVVLGHSLGDFAAAYSAGVLSLEDGLRLVTERGRLMETALGSMLSVLASEAEVAPFIEDVDDVTLGVINGPTSVVISGSHEGVATVAAQLQEAGYKTRKLDIPVAAHSPMLDPVLDAFEAAVKKTQRSVPTVTVISSMSGNRVVNELTEPGYWRQHLRNTVRFADGVERLCAEGCTIFVEIGPKSTLLGIAEQLPAISQQPTTIHMLPSLREGQSDWQQLLQSAGVLYTAGVTLDWAAMDHLYVQRKIALPTYPFQRQRYWLQSKRTHQEIGRTTRAVAHPLLGYQRDTPLAGAIFETTLHPDLPAYVAEHQVYDNVVVPGAAYVEMILAAVETYLRQNSIFEAAISLQICDLLIQQAMILHDEDETTIQIIVEELADLSERFSCGVNIYSLEQDATEGTPAWTCHVSSRVQMVVERAGPTRVDLHQLTKTLETEMTAEDHYALCDDQQISYGPSFQGITQLWTGEGQALGHIKRPDTLDPSAVASYRFHPALLDACFQVFYRATVPGTYMPIAIDEIAIHALPAGSMPISDELWCHVQMHDNHDDAVMGAHQNGASDRTEKGPDASPQSITADMRLFTPDGTVVAESRGFTFKKAAWHTLAQARSQTPSALMYDVVWKEAARKQVAMLANKMATTWLIFADTRGEQAKIGEALQQKFAQGEQRCIFVRPGASFYQQSDTEYIVNPATPADFDLLLQQVGCGEDQTPSSSMSLGLIHLWGFDSDIPADRPNAQDAAIFEEMQLLHCGSLLHLVQAVTKGNKPEERLPKLWLVTRNAQRINGTDTIPNPTQAPLWGMGRSIALEWPELWGGLIDVDVLSADDAAASILTELSANDVEDQVVFRQGKRYVPRLAHANAEDLQLSFEKDADEPFAIDADSLYLVTGGLGTLGLQVARWLVQQGARHLVLMGRTGLPTEPSQEDTTTLAAERARAVAELEASGATVHIITADVADWEEINGAFAQMATLEQPLRGLIHAAGTITYQTLDEISLPTMQRLFRPKIAGTWYLHQLTAGMTLDFFVLFSSAAAIWGGARLAAYGAANAFLDGLAHYRHGQGSPATSINWARFDAQGLLADEEADTLARIGLNPMPMAQALDGMGQLIHAAIPQKTMAAVRWSRFYASYTAHRERPFLAELAPAAAPKKTSSNQHGSTTHESQPDAFQQRVVDAMPQQRLALLTEHVEKAVAQILGWNGAHTIDPQQGLQEMGLDSLMAIRLKNQLETTVGHALPTTLAFNYPTVNALATYLYQNFFSEEALATKVITEAATKAAAETAKGDQPIPDADTQPARTELSRFTGEIRANGISPANLVPDLENVLESDLSEDDLIALLAEELAQIKGAYA